MADNKGVSLVQVIIAIVIIIIITSFAIWYASNTSTEAKLTRIYAEITAVKEGYDNAKMLNEVNSTAYDFSKIESSEVYIKGNYESKEIEFMDKISDTSELYLVTPDNAKEIEVEKIVFDYVIDGKTGNVYLIGGYESRLDENLKNNVTVVYEYKDIVREYQATLR